MKINISYTSEKPMYEQIEDCIRKAVFSGELEQNQPMPSVRQLASDINVSTITVKRAYSDLEREGVLYTVSGKGTFIKLDNMQQLISEHEKLLLCEFEKNVSALNAAGIPLEKLNAAIKKIYNGQENN